MGIPPGRLTRGTIIDHALSQLGNTKIKARAREALNFILYDLNTQYEWPHLYTVATVTLTAATFSLPSDFLKTQDDNSLTITADGSITTKQVVLEMDRQQFEALAYPSDTNGTPEYWTVDRAADVGRLWPVPNTTLTGTLRYKALPDDVDESDTTTYDADTPSFPWSRHLIQEVFVWGLQYENDPRYQIEEVKRQHQLGVVREAALPLHSTINKIPLDPNVFKTPFYGD
ncbi:MAG: phage adaptor protein [Candidatus Thorarchaeota archaeon]|jgi:hypothetical protein